MPTATPTAEAFYLALRRRLREVLHHRRSGLVLMAVLIGIGAGLGALVFRWLIATFTYLFSGHADYAATPGEGNPLFGIGPWFVIFAPVLAGLLYGPLVYFFAPQARGHGVPEVMYAVARKGGKIPAKVAVVKSLASAICIGGGGSVGREGPIVQIGASLGSALGRFVRLPENRLKLLVACGSAGGIAATFNAPLAGCFFAMELILLNFSAETFGMVVISSFTASVVGLVAIGEHHMLSLPQFPSVQIPELGWIALLGILGGGLGVVFMKVLYAIEDGVDYLWRGRPEWARPAVGGLALGLFLFAVPQMYGVGYPVLGDAVLGKLAIGTLALMLLAKIIGTSLTLAIGGSGGVFAPSLFIGAMFGALFGNGVHDLAGGNASVVGVYAVIGMGAVFAGSARAPITAVLIIVELTQQYDLILPLMLAVVLATLTSRFLSLDTMYTLKLRRRGDSLVDPVARSVLEKYRIASVMDSAPSALTPETSLQEAARAFSKTRYRLLPVVNGEGQYLGAVSALRVTVMLADENEDVSRVADIPLVDDHVHIDAPMHDVLERMMTSAVNALPVLSDDRLAGWITQRTLMRKVMEYDERVTAPSDESALEDRLLRSWRRRKAH
ncbi:chloride channel protein [Dermabacteraceae bacterium P13103]